MLSPLLRLLLPPLLLLLLLLLLVLLLLSLLLLLLLVLPPLLLLLVALLLLLLLLLPLLPRMLVLPPLLLLLLLLRCGAASLRLRFLVALVVWRWALAADARRPAAVPRSVGCHQLRQIDRQRSAVEHALRVDFLLLEQVLL